VTIMPEKQPDPKAQQQQAARQADQGKVAEALKTHQQADQQELARLKEQQARSAVPAAPAPPPPPAAPPPAPREPAPGPWKPEDRPAGTFQPGSPEAEGMRAAGEAMRAPDPAGKRYVVLHGRVAGYGEGEEVTREQLGGPTADVGRLVKLGAVREVGPEGEPAPGPFADEFGRVSAQVDRALAERDGLLTELPRGTPAPGAERPADQEHLLKAKQAQLDALRAGNDDLRALRDDPERLAPLRSGALGEGAQPGGGGGQAAPADEAKSGALRQQGK
jgi:hypothetical protein